MEENIKDIDTELFEQAPSAPEADNTAEDTGVAETVEVVGIKFKTSGKTYYFDPDGKQYKEGTNAVVDTARGMEYGFVSMANAFVGADEIVPPLRRAIRPATEEDDRHYEENTRKEQEAFSICAQQIEHHKLGMKLVGAEYTFDNSKLLFYFSADGRVDFRELVKDLASVFRTRIELRQIGIRDEAKMIGGFGVCGRPFCCSTFLPDFVQVSIKMAKEQNLSLNSSKISGACGRLMCCLRYEHETYEEAIRAMPKNGSTVYTPDGQAIVIETQPLAALVKVKMADDESKIKCWDLADITDRPVPRRERTDRAAPTPRKERNEQKSDTTPEKPPRPQRERKGEKGPRPGRREDRKNRKK